jgi:hypothetical protein
MYEPNIDDDFGRGRVVVNKCKLRKTVALKERREAKDR